MTDGRARVARVMDGGIEVEMPEGWSPDPVPADDASPDTPGWDGVDPGPPPAPPGDDPEGPPPPEAACVDHPLNDYGNGLRLVAHFGGDLVWVPRVGWFVWATTRWQVDPDGIAVRRLAHRLSDLIAREIHWLPLSDPDRATLEAGEEAARILDELGVIKRDKRTEDQIDEMARAARLKAQADDVKDRRDKSIGRRLTHAKNVGNTNAIKNLLTEASASIARPLADMDASPLDINTLGGVLRFTMVPGEDDGGSLPPHPVARLDVLPHAREQLLTKVIPVDYDPAARCPGFIAFLDRVQPNREMQRFLQRWFGYSLTGLTAEQKFAFLYGTGANGKSVLMDLIARIAGDYAASAKIESITGKNRRGGGDATPDLIPLIGARLVRTSEPDEGQHLQEGLIKELTGGEPILVRALNENFILVYPIFKLTISGNHRPEIRGGDDGIWRRVMLVPFDVQIPPAERDPELGAKLWDERAGILNWLITGLLDYLTHGLQVPDQVIAATQEYREDSDPMATFLTECCKVTGAPDDSLSARDLGEAFTFWMEDTGRGAWQPRTVFNKLKAKAGRWKSPATGATFTVRKNSTIFYDGVRLAEPFRTAFVNAPPGAGRHHSEGAPAWPAVTPRTPT